jgi:neutral/alkaline ceramidase-like enzyme
MKTGIAQIDITPKPGVRLSGFAARTQPSVGILDPLYAKALYLTEGDTKLLWLHCDLIGFEREIVLSMRRWARTALELRGDQVILSATHTHSGPCTIRLNGAGTYDEDYVEQLLGWLKEAAQAAVRRTTSCVVSAVESRLALAIDRRNTPTSHTDPRVGAVGFRRENGDFVAVIVNYPIHPVALGSSNRYLSADIPGQAALSLSAQLPGRPMVLVSNGACANLNPPAENVSFDQIKAWGRQIADTVADLLPDALPLPADLRVTARVIPLPMDTLTAAGIKEFAGKALQDSKSIAKWGDTYSNVVTHWRDSMTATVNAGHAISHSDAELFAISFGKIILLGANAEVFSEFTDWLRASDKRHIYLLGYANGTLGYLPARSNYLEGGYEVDVAHLFYGGFRPKAGGLELLAKEAGKLLRTL